MDIMTLTQRIGALRTKLDTVDIYGQSLDVCMWTGGWTVFRLEVSYRVGEAYTSDRKEFVRTLNEDERDELVRTGEADEWIEQVLIDAENWIDAIPSKDERDHEQFTAALGRLIDQGRDLGIEVDFLNPLTQMMERLATNALEDKRRS
jgi:hypothetical protein